jgi:hypothetical protein
LVACPNFIRRVRGQLAATRLAPSSRGWEEGWLRGRYAEAYFTAENAVGDRM